MIQDRDLLSVQEARTLIHKARAAQEKAAELPQETIDACVRAMAQAGYDHAEELAAMAVEETGFGNVPDKIIKNRFASEGLLASIAPMKTVGVIRTDEEKKLWEVAVPVGVVTGLIPSTNPTSTVIYKAMIAVKAGCAIVFSPHPAAKKCILRATELMEQAAQSAGAPPDIVQCMQLPHMEGTKELMTNEGVNLILATGGREMVKAAYSSGIPALGVGPGNVPAFIERSADIPKAVRDILSSKTFDNGVICASEQAVVTEDCIRERVLDELVNQGCYLLTDEEAKKVGGVLMRAGGRLNPFIVGKTAAQIAAMVGIQLPEGKRVLLYPEKGVGAAYPFSIEKLSPTLAFYSEADWHKACERCLELLRFGGMGHSLVIHSEDMDVIREFALRKPVSRMLVNTPSSQGAIGATTGLMPALTLGCGSVGGSATSDNVTPLHLINIRRVAWGLPSKEAALEAGADTQEIERITRLVIEALQAK